MINELTFNHSESVVCLTLDVPRSSYRHSQNDGKAVIFNKELEDLRLRNEIEKLINLPVSSRYGYRPMTHQLKRNGFQINNKDVNHKRVLRVMRENNLLCEIKKSFISTTDSDHNLKKYPNLLKKEKIKVTGINQVWVSDITYVRLPEGFVYLAVILDAYSRKVIGYCLSVNIDTDLVVTALEMAIRERGIIDAKNKLIHHSDKGVQYSSKTYTKKLKSVGIRISMSGTGKPWENGMAESFFKTLKTNEVYLNDYQDIYEAKDKLFKFLNDVYNEKRLHSSLGYLPPNEFEELKKSEKKSLKN